MGVKFGNLFSLSEPRQRNSSYFVIILPFDFSFDIFRIRTVFLPFQEFKKNVKKIKFLKNAIMDRYIAKVSFKPSCWKKKVLVFYTNLF